MLYTCILMYTIHAHLSSITYSNCQHEPTMCMNNVTLDYSCHTTIHMPPLPTMNSDTVLGWQNIGTWADRWPCIAIVSRARPSYLSQWLEGVARETSIAMHSCIDSCNYRLHVDLRCTYNNISLLCSCQAVELAHCRASNQFIIPFSRLQGITVSP